MLSFLNSLLIATFLICNVKSGYAKEPPGKIWIGTWGTAPQLVEPNNMPPSPGLTNNTLRQVVRVSIGGKKMRLKFSNAFSESPVNMKAVQIAVSKGGSGIDESTIKTLKFDGKSEVTMAPGTELTSDAILFNLEPRMELAITIFFGETSATTTGHPGSRTTSYLLTGKNLGAKADFTKATTTDHWYVISGIDVQASKPAAAVVAFGDSITDGRGSGTNKQNRWPDMLSLCLLNNQNTRTVAVLNMGIGGNALLNGGLGPTGFQRFEHDVLMQKGVRWVIVMEGVNDLGGKKDSTTAVNIARGLIDAYDKMIVAAHTAGIKVYGATITPIKNSFYYTDYSESARQTVNNWIRNSGHFDAVVDFDKAIRNPADPLSMLPEAQSGDYLHPNELGYKMMGASINLSLFK